MRIPMTIEDVRLIEDGIWEGRLQADDLRVFHASPKSYGTVSVVIVNDPSLKFDQHRRRITFDLLWALLANRGDTDRVIIVRGCEAPCQSVTPSNETATREGEYAGGDEQFLRGLRALPQRVRDVGRELLAEIRAEFGGGLKYHPISKSYVQTPDKFWAVRIQPEDRSLRIVVRGEPEYFGPVTGITLKPDRTSYSSFKISKPSQLAAALSIIKSAKRE